jgi:TP901 family phage tail tape measure protein
MANYSIDYLLKVKDSLTPALKKAMSAKKALEKQFSKPLKIIADTRSAESAINKLRLIKPLTMKVMADTSSARASLAHDTNKKSVNSRKAGVGEAAGAVGGGVLLTQGIQAALEMDRALTSLEKITNGSKQELDRFQASAIKMSSETGLSAASIIEMMTSASKAGTAVGNLNKQVMDAVKVSVAYDMSSEDTTVALRNIRAGLFSGTKDFATQQKQVMKVAETISYLADTSESSEAYLSGFLSRASGMVTAFKQPVQSVLALGGAFEAVGTYEETAARAVNSLGISMAKITASGEDVDFASKMMGISPRAFKKSVDENLITTMLNLVDATKTMGTMERQVKIKDLFGGEFGDDLIRVSASIDTYKKNLQLANDETKQTGTIQKQFAVAMSRVNKQLEIAKEGIKTAIGQAALPVLEAMTAAGNAMLEVFKAHPIIIKFVAAAAMAAVALGALAIAASFVTAPMLLIVGAVAGVIQELWDNSETVRETLRGLGRTLGVLGTDYEVNTGALNFFKDALASVGLVVGSLILGIDLLIITIKTLFKAMFAGSIKGGLQALRDGSAEIGAAARKANDAMAKDLSDSAARAASAKSLDNAKRQAGLTATQQTSASPAQQNAQINNNAALISIDAAKTQKTSAFDIKIASINMLAAAEKMASFKYPMTQTSMGTQGR